MVNVFVIIHNQRRQIKMCNVFSGLIVTKKGKDWGKVEE
jgi:hypothetical protein